LIHEEGEKASGAAIVFKDLTRIERMAEQKKLKDRLMALGQMAVGFAHEIRNPLASIEFTVSRLKRKLNHSTEELALLDKVLSETVRLNSTISHALDFVRPLEPDFQMANIHDILDLANAGAQKKLNAGGIEYVRKYAPDVQPFLMDERQLGQVFLNLLVNAGESIGPGQGRISIATDYFRAFPVKKGRSQTEWDESADDFVLIKIADTGRGICKEDQDKIFLPFFTTKETGSGLGLALAQKIIDSHDGQIDVDSRPEEGTLFRVKLPVRLQTQRAGT